ncbi:hypothetical protein BDN72DRAFT_842730 [Pluteus cervinus]|uniref:Uncharacterized protein n=1 Tax=Pluteus cervinus TaxID=181527 RepID=A0ACD3AS20_9AGAR|nr:hypothetical protein BDN72DRAFT_842730 [Pluteus cervinus]
MCTPAHALPIEIWEEICGYACTDGGFTGRSLSCTSRSINQLTKRMKLYSLAIIRTRQLFHLAAKFLQKEELGGDEEIEGIRHLFVILPQLFLEDASAILLDLFVEC